jgi:hypothetical protein
VTKIEQRFGREFEAYDRLIFLADDLLSRNAEKFAIDRARRRTRVAALLYARARKAVDAVRILAAWGYGEDGMVLARSLVNVCIDLAYICELDSDDRTEQWIANGRLARRRMAQEFGLKTEDEETADWEKTEKLAKQWRDVTIEQRAKAAGLENFYKVLYRHGSSFEHSDLWAVNSLLERGEQGPELKTEPRENLVPQALFACYTFSQIMVTVGRLFGFEFAGAEAEMLRVAQEGLHFAGPSTT